MTDERAILKLNLKQCSAQVLKKAGCHLSVEPGRDLRDMACFLFQCRA